MALNEAYRSMLNEKLEMSITSPDQGRPGVVEIVKDDKVVWKQEFKKDSERGAVEANAKAEMKKMEMGEAKDYKPDFLDIDKDGDKEEPMKKAAAEAEEKNEMFGLSRIEKAAKRLRAVHGNSAEFEAELESLSNELSAKELGAVGIKLYKGKFKTASKIEDKNDMVAAIGRQRRRTEDIAAA